MSDLSESLNIHPDPFEKSVVSHSNLSATVKSDPHDALKQKLEITLESSPSPCRVTHAVKQGSQGRIQYAGGFWKAQLFPLQSISQIDPILPTHPACVVARKGNICFVLPESLACSRNSRKEFSSIVKQELLGIRDPRKSSPRKPGVELITSLLFIIFIFFMGPFFLRSSSFSSGNDTTYHQNMKSYL